MSRPSTLLLRPDKGNHAETVLYEIDMLRFTRDRLLAPTAAWTESDQWVYLEGFLLHYRNLIEFFGKSKQNKDVLTIKRADDFWNLGKIRNKKESRIDFNISSSLCEAKNC